jgi:hypothetical protein
MDIRFHIPKLNRAGLKKKCKAGYIFREKGGKIYTAFHENLMLNKYYRGMKKTWFAGLLFFAVKSTIAQQDVFSKEINGPVWKPFIRSFNAGDDEGFEAVPGKNIMR